MNMERSRLNGAPIASLGRHGARLKELRRRLRQRRQGEVWVDGLRFVCDLVTRQVSLRELYLAASVAAETAGAERGDLAALVAAAGAVWQLPDDLLSAIAPTRHTQGVLAMVPEPAARPWPGTSGVALYLDGVQEPGNLGAIVRCATGLGAQAVLLSPDCADPFHPAAVRGSAGTVLHLPPERGISAEHAATRVRAGGGVWAAAGVPAAGVPAAGVPAAGVPAAGVPAAGVPVDRWRPQEPVLLLLGSEGSGLSEAACTVTHRYVTIPLDRGVESLNVAVAAGILLQALRSTGMQKREDPRESDQAGSGSGNGACALSPNAGKT